MQVER